MARMVPDQIAPDTKSPAERKVFEALKSDLSDEYMVFHRVPLLERRGRDARLLDGELDFLLAHPSRGLMVIEVKGGGIDFDGPSQTWFSTALDGTKYQIKNPYEQSKRCCYFLLDELRRNLGTAAFDYPAGHGVWFPDIDLSGRDLGVAHERVNTTLDLNDLTTVGSAIGRLFKNSVPSRPGRLPGADAIAALRNLLAPSFSIRVKLAHAIEDDSLCLREATNSQYKVLSILQRQPRALICGAAGTGKTFLAVEKARRMVEQDEATRVALVCFNIRLASFLKKMVSGLEGVETFYFHELCEEFCRKAGLHVPNPESCNSPATYYNDILPSALLDALSQTDYRYDALIVDEGQDFESHWWVPLMEVLRKPEEDTLYIFYDDSQPLYRTDWQFPKVGPVVTLTENCRNTKLIHEEAMKYYCGSVPSDPIGPEGRAPQFVKMSNQEDEKTVVGTIIRDLIRKQKVSPNQIAILTPRTEKKSIWKTGEVVCGCRLGWSPDAPLAENIIRCSTIHAFKGLESPVVVLSETSKIYEKARDQLLYVGMSRAMSHLIIVGL